MTSKSMRIRVNQGEMMPIKPDVVQRSDVGPGGTRGLWDGFGTLTIRVGDRDVLLVRLQENDRGEAVLRAATAPGIATADARMQIGGSTVFAIDANLERAGLIAPDATSRDRGWIAPAEGQPNVGPAPKPKRRRRIEDSSGVPLFDIEITEEDGS